MRTEPFAFLGSIEGGDRNVMVEFQVGNSMRGHPQKLVAQLELFGDRGIPFHVRVVKIIEQAAALANHH